MIAVFWTTKKKCHFFLFFIERYILWDIKSEKKIQIAWEHFCLWFFKVFSEFVQKRDKCRDFSNFFSLDTTTLRRHLKCMKKFLGCIKHLGRKGKTVWKFSKWSKIAAINCQWYLSPGAFKGMMIIIQYCWGPPTFTMVG